MLPVRRANYTLVKICGITNLEDAQAAVAAGADMLGFNFWPRSPRYIAPRDARKIISCIPDEVLSIGVFVDAESPAAVELTAGQADVAAVQLHGAETPEYCSQVTQFPVVKALRVGESFVPARVADYPCAAILLDAYVQGLPGGTGAAFDWQMANDCKEFAQKLFLAGGLAPENIARAIEVVRPYAVDACSRLERAPGIKDHELVAKFVSLVRTVRVSA